MNRRLGSSLVAMALLVAPITVVTATPASAKISHDLAIKNVGSVNFDICTHWGYPAGRVEGPSCSINGSATKYGYLKPGEWSDRRYTDAEFKDIDGYAVNKGCKMKEDLPGPNPSLTGYHTKRRWHKISPRVTITGIDHTRKLYIKCR